MAEGAWGTPEGFGDPNEGFWGWLWGCWGQPRGFGDAGGVGGTRRVRRLGGFGDHWGVWGWMGGFGDTNEGFGDTKRVWGPIPGGFGDGWGGSGDTNKGFGDTKRLWGLQKGFGNQFQGGLGTTGEFGAGRLGALGIEWVWGQLGGVWGRPPHPRGGPYGGSSRTGCHRHPHPRRPRGPAAAPPRAAASPCATCGSAA